MAFHVSLGLFQSSSVVQLPKGRTSQNVTKTKVELFKQVFLVMISNMKPTCNVRHGRKNKGFADRNVVL